MIDWGARRREADLRRLMNVVIVLGNVVWRGQEREADYLRGVLRQEGLVVLHARTTAEQLERELAASNGDSPSMTHAQFQDALVDCLWPPWVLRRLPR